jgi:hypothetical protein
MVAFLWPSSNCAGTLMTTSLTSTSRYLNDTISLFSKSTQFINGIQ